MKWQNGDLLFQDLDNDSISDAIENVTGEGRSLNFSHVGMLVLEKDGSAVVLEAISKGVSKTPLDTFLLRSVTSDGRPKVVVGRLKARYVDRIPQAIAFGESLVGSPYDKVFVIGDSSYYCSELIYEMMRHSGDSSDIFMLNPMSFKDPQTGQFNPTWVDYYQSLGVDIPEGKLGLNPNGMSHSENIEMIFKFTENDK